MSTQVVIMEDFECSYHGTSILVTRDPYRALALHYKSPYGFHAEKFLSETNEKGFAQRTLKSISGSISVNLYFQMFRVFVQQQDGQTLTFYASRLVTSGRGKPSWRWIQKVKQEIKRRVQE